MTALHKFEDTHIDEKCTGVSGYHHNELFFNCTFDRVAGLTLDHCDLNRSKFEVDSVRDALGFTLTLSCPSFKSVRYSPLLMDLLLYLLTTTEGNDDLRAKLVDLIGEEKVKTFARVLRSIE